MAGVAPRWLLLVLLFGILVIPCMPLEAEEWPEFRGPTGQGHSTETSVPIEWSESRNVAWKTPVPGAGWSSPVVAGGRVWLTTATEDAGGGTLRALAYDVATGREVVNTEVFRIRSAAPLNDKNTRASPTPILDGDRVYVHFGADGTAALTTAGEVLWKARFDYNSQHGDGGSPALYGDLLIVNCDGDDEAFVVAVDKQSGKVRWKTTRRRPFAQAYSTPLVIRVGDRDELISVGAFRAVAYEPQTGREIWRVSYPVRFPEGFSNVLRPVYGAGLLFISGGFNVPSFIAVRPDGTGDVTATHVAWTLDRGIPLTPSPLVVGEDLYVVSDNGIAACLDARRGQTYWRQRLNGNYSASPVHAGGRIYFLNEEGLATVIEPGHEFRTVATNRVDGDTLASIAVSNGSLFIRTGTHLYRIRSPQPSPAR
jgi:outer membrane protein assembly factor BamB